MRAMYCLQGQSTGAETVCLNTWSTLCLRWLLLCLLLEPSLLVEERACITLTKKVFISQPKGIKPEHAPEAWAPARLQPSAGEPTAPL